MFSNGSNKDEALPLWKLPCSGCGRSFFLGLNATLTSWESVIKPNTDDVIGTLGDSAFPDLIGLSRGNSGFEEYPEPLTDKQLSSHEYGSLPLRSAVAAGTTRSWDCHECKANNRYSAPPEMTVLTGRPIILISRSLRDG